MFVVDKMVLSNLVQRWLPSAFCRVFSTFFCKLDNSIFLFKTLHFLYVLYTFIYNEY